MALPGYGLGPASFAGLLTAPPPGWQVACLGLPRSEAGRPIAMDEAWLDQLWQTLDQQIGADRCHLLGFSMGGKWAMALRLRRPDPQATDFLLAPDGIWTHPVQRLTLGSQVGQVLLRWALAQSDWVLKRGAQLYRLGLLRRSDHYFLRQHFSTPTQRQRLWENNLAYRPLRLGRQQLRQFARQTPPDWHLVWGDRDQVLPPQTAHRLQRLVPGLRLHWLAGVGHDLPGKAADSIRELLDRWLWGSTG